MISRTLIIVSAVLNVCLGILLYRVFPSLEETKGIRAGVRVPGFEGDTSFGQRLSISFPAAQPVVLYFFAPHCAWCERNYESMSALGRRLEGRFRFTAVAVEEDGLTDWILRRKPSFTVIERPTYRSANAFRVQTTPTTVVLNKEGIVERIWRGAYVGIVQQEIEAYFETVLPGVQR